jgi:hypothetical protein
MKDKELRQALKDAGIFYGEECSTPTYELTSLLESGVGNTTISSLNHRIKYLEKQVEMLIKYLNIRVEFIEASTSFVDKEEE